MSGLKYKIVLMLAFLGLPCAAVVNGQNFGTMNPGFDNFNDGQYQDQMIGANPFEDEEEGEQQDSLKQKRERKPLESYFFDNETRAQNNFMWNVDTHKNKVHMSRIDTLLNDYHVDYPFLKEGVGDAYLGNLGAPSVPLNFYSRPRFRDFQMAEPLYSYIYTPENAPFYNVKNPFTQLQYHTTVGPRQNVEEVISVIHAQNIGPATGFNLTYHTMGTKGIYQNQATRNTDFSAGVSHTGKKYTGHVGYIFNTVRMKENGGIIDEYYVKGETKERPFEIPVMLNDAANVINNHTVYTVHSYGIPLRRLTEDDFTIADIPAIFIGYSFQYDKWTRRYSDTYAQMEKGDPTGGTETLPKPTRPIYENWYLNNAASRDTTFESKMSNRLFVQLQPWDRNGVVGTIDAGIGMDVHRYYQFNPDNYLTGNFNGVREESYYVYGGADGRYREYFEWGGEVRYVPFGYRQHDIDVEGRARLTFFIKKKPVSLSGNMSYSHREPSYWSGAYLSNHFKWNNSFLKEDVTRLEVKLYAPEFGAEVAFYQSVLNNWVYFGPDRLPVQHTEDLVSVTGVYARKDFRFGGFHMNHRVLLQWSTNQQVAPVPLVSAYLSYFFEFQLVKDVFRVRIGVDGRYNTPYEAFGYDPSNGQFYNQNSTMVGGYPMLDLFVSAKWKRARIMLKVAHLNEDFFRYNQREYFQIANYPLNKRVFKIGVSWNFYD